MDDREGAVRGGNVKQPREHQLAPPTRRQKTVAFVVFIVFLIVGTLASTLISQATVDAQNYATAYVRTLTKNLLAAPDAAAFNNLAAGVSDPAPGYTVTLSAPVRWAVTNPGKQTPTGKPTRTRFAVTVRWADGAGVYSCDSTLRRCLNSSVENGVTISKYEDLMDADQMLTPR